MTTEPHYQVQDVINKYPFDHQIKISIHVEEEDDHRASKVSSGGCSEQEEASTPNSGPQSSCVS